MIAVYTNQVARPKLEKEKLRHKNPEIEDGLGIIKVNSRLDKVVLMSKINMTYHREIL